MSELLKQLAVEIVELMKIEEDNKVMNTKQCALYLQTTENEVRRLARANQIPHVRLGSSGNRIRFHRDAIDKWLGV